MIDKFIKKLPTICVIWKYGGRCWGICQVMVNEEIKSVFIDNLAFDTYD